MQEFFNVFDKERPPFRFAQIPLRASYAPRPCALTANRLPYTLPVRLTP